MAKIQGYAYSQFSKNPELNSAENFQDQSPEAIPRWISNKYLDSESGQQMLIPDSDESSLIAKAPLSQFLCCNTSFPFGEYKVSFYEGCKILELLSQEELEEYCSKASDHCKLSMEHANQGKVLFCFGFIFMLIFCVLVILMGVVYEFAWVSVIVILFFVFGVGFLYEIINTRARGIRESLLGFIEVADKFKERGVEVKAGPNGIYLEFALQVNKPNR